MPVLVYPVDQPQIPPLSMSDRFRHEVAYFMSIPGEGGVPNLPPGEYWIGRENAQVWADEGVISLVSPLDSENRTEVELSEEHETWLQWLLDHQIQHVRLK